MPPSLLNGDPARVAQQLAAQLSRLQARVEQLELGNRTTQLTNSSIDNGFVSVYDDAGRERARVGLQEDGTFAADSRNNPDPPPAPDAPLADGAVGGVLVTASGSSTGSWPSDFSHLNVYHAEVGEIGPGRLAGSMPGRQPAPFLIAPLSPGTERVWLTAVNQSGVESDPSEERIASPLQVDPSTLEDGSVPGDVLTLGSVTEALLADGSVTPAKLARELLAAINAAVPRTVAVNRGDLLVASGPEGVTRHPASFVDGQILYIDMSSPTGIRWGTPSTAAVQVVSARTSGLATIAAGATAVTVTHGVTITSPTAANVVLTPTNSLGSATKWWIDAVTTTTFTINVNVAPGASTATFAWQFLA